MNGNVNEKNVVLAEDDIDDVLIFELAIKELHIPIQLRHAVDGEVLFVILAKEVPDMLFLDINMPCQDGISCLSAIRNDKKYDNMPIIMLTGMKMHKTIEEAYRKGANFYITKTHTIHELTNKLRKILSFEWDNTMIYPTLRDFVVH